MVHVFKILNQANNPDVMVCPKCHYGWELRTTQPRKCPNCQINLYKAREPWPAGFTTVDFSEYAKINKDWPQEDDPDPEPDYGWQSQQRRLAIAAEERMRGRA